MVPLATVPATREVSRHLLSGVEGIFGEHCWALEVSLNPCNISHINMPSLPNRSYSSHASSSSPADIASNP